MLNPMKSPVNEPEKTPEIENLNTAPENTSEKVLSPEGLPYTPMTSMEKENHILRMEAFAEELGFVKTPELSALEGNMIAWNAEAESIVDKSTTPGTPERIKINFGSALALASVYFKQGNKPDEYFGVMDKLEYALRDGKFHELWLKLKSLE